MKKVLQSGFGILFSVLSVMLVSCVHKTDEFLTIGDNFVDPNTRIELVDSFGISVSTLLFDSVVTTGADVAIIGQHFNEKTGNITSSSFFQLQLPSSYSIDEDDVYDSVAVVLEYSGYYFGDTTQLYSLTVNRVLEDIELFDDDNLYNNSSFVFDEVPLGALSFYPRPLNGEDVHIKLDDEFGFDLFEKLRNEDDEITTSDEFLNFFKGLTLQSNNEVNQSVLGFNLVDSSLSIKLYYHRIEEELVEMQTSFKVLNNNLRFNNTENDHSNTILSDLVIQKEAKHSTLTEDVAYLKGGAGLMPSIAFPWLGSLLEVNNADILKAELVLYPIVNDLNNDNFPESFFLFKVGKYNTVEEVYADSEGNPYYGTFEIDEIYNEAKITFDVTQYIKYDLADYYHDTNQKFVLCYGTPEYATSINQLEIGGYENARYKPELRIYYIRYDAY